MISTWIFKSGWRLSVLLLTVLVGSCADMSYQEQIQASMCGTAYAADPAHPSGACQTMGAQYGYYMPVTPMPPTQNPYWTPTLSMYDLGITQIAVQQNAAATNQANQLQLQREQMAAEERARQQATAAYYAEETAAAYRVQSTANAQATAMQFELDMQGTQMVATAQAIATATNFQYMLNQQNTAAAAAATNAVAPTHAIMTVTAQAYSDRIKEGEARKVELAVRRQELKNGLDAFAPWLLSIVVLAVSGWGYMKFVKVRPFERDAFGSRPILSRDVKGGVVYYLPDLAKTGATYVGDDGRVMDYGPIDQQEFPNVMRRAQGIEAIKALPSEMAGAGKQMINIEYGRQGGGRVTISPTSTNSMGPVLDEAERNLIEDVNY
jgi:hypothetical protein